jgi:hypothetical protein
MLFGCRAINLQRTSPKETQDSHLPPRAHLQRNHDPNRQYQDGEVNQDIGDAIKHAQGLVSRLHGVLADGVKDEERQDHGYERLEAEKSNDAVDGPAKRANGREAQVKDEDGQAREGQG